jgi:hypothetical protein
MTPQPADESGTASTVTSQMGRFLLEKQFHGDLEATSIGQMLSAGTQVQGSAAYVAIEIVTGRLNELSGSFALVHRGLMVRGVPDLQLSVVPDSGTGELVGLVGSMAIDRSDGKHSYAFEYSINPEA